jgi:hypothetical protein
MKDYVGKDVFGNSIFMAKENKIAKERTNCDRLLLMVGKYMGWKGDISHVFVSDLSTMGDFCLKESQLAAIAKQLGFKISNADYLHKIASKMTPEKQPLAAPSAPQGGSRE